MGFDGHSWQAYDAPATGQSRPTVSALAVAPTGELWVAQTPGQPHPLRFYDGTAWTNVPLPAPTMFVACLLYTSEIATGIHPSSLILQDAGYHPALQG